MGKIWLMVAIGLIIAIIGVIIAKFSIDKGKGILAVIGAFLTCIGCFTTYLGYDAYMLQPQTFRVSDFYQVGDKYRVTLESELKGMTNGSIYLSEDEAKLYKFIDTEGNNLYLTEFTESRRWVSNHRE